MGLKRAFLVSRPTPSWRLTTRPGTKPCGRLQGSGGQVLFGSIGNVVISDCSLLRRTVPMVAPSSGLLNPMIEPFRWRLYRDWTLPGTAGGQQIVVPYSYPIEGQGETPRSRPVPASSKNGSLKYTLEVRRAPGPGCAPRPPPLGQAWCRPP